METNRKVITEKGKVISKCGANHNGNKINKVDVNKDEKKNQQKFEEKKFSNVSTDDKKIDSVSVKKNEDEVNSNE